MEIIDLKKYSKNKLLPISKYGDLLLISENKEFKDYSFTEPGILNYYLYNIESKKINKIDRDKCSILVDTFHEKEIEGEDAHYYITMKKQLFENQYFLNKISIEKEESHTIFEFKMDKKYPKLDFEVLDNDHILVFYKQEEVYDFENFDYDKEQYGFDRGILYNITNGEEYEIKDTKFLRGFRLVFFKTTIMNEMCVVFEENYLESYDKEQIYMNHHMNKSKKEKFFYKDCLKYSTLEKFLNEVKEGKEKISFIDIESRGSEGYEMFSGTDENNIYSLVGNFGDEESYALVMVDKLDLSKKIIKLPEGYDEEEGIVHVRYICCLEDKYKSVFQLKYLTDEKIEMKEVINGNINYTYSNKLGTIQSYIEEKFLIACVNNKETSVIDVENNNIKSFNRESKVFGEYLILY